MATELCIACKNEVNRRRHALQCDQCEKWQHRLCGTGISQTQYWALMRGQLALRWVCEPCNNDVRTENGETTMDDETPLITEVSEIPSEIPSTNVITMPDTTSSLNDTDPMVEMESRIADHTFDLSNRDFQQPANIADESVHEIPLDDDVPEDHSVTYEEVEKGTKRGGRMLLSSDGYSYNVRRSKDKFVYWVCSVRSAKLRCSAWVKKYDDTYVACSHGHQHPANPGVNSKVKVAAKVKQLAKENIHVPAARLVQTVMAEIVRPDQPILPNIVNITRAANLHRQNMRPNEPGDAELDFEVNSDFIKADRFLVDDFMVDGQRHIMFATKEQLSHLKIARRWFIDGTFKVVRRPFYQLMSIHAFVKSGDNAKQIPLLFVLMSKRRKTDYTEVFRRLKEKLGDPLVEWFMMDYESATWHAVREVFPNTIIKGCAFHWSQRIYRKVTRLGLATAYTEKGDKFLFIRKILALPYLPAEHIRPTFDRLENTAQESNCRPLQSLTQYVRVTWMEGQMWKPENWSVFRETVRTNNDVEGWHRRLNARAAGSNLPFYVLVPMLYGEAQFVELQARLVSQNIVTRIHRKQYRNIHAKLFNLWDEYEDEEKTTTQLLREVSQIIGLGPIPSSANDRCEDNDNGDD